VPEMHRGKRYCERRVMNLSDLEKIIAVATDGPWIAAKRSNVVGIPVIAGGTGRGICNAHMIPQGIYDIKVPGDHAFNAESETNAAFIAASRQALPAALRVIALAKEALEDAQMRNGYQKQRVTVAEALSALAEFEKDVTNDNR